MLGFTSGADSEIIGAIRPRYLCVSPSNFLTAIGLTGANMATGDITGSRLGVLCEPEIGRILGDAAWLLAADPVDISHTLAVYLGGDLLPTISVRSGQAAESKGTYLDIQQYFAPLAVDFRGWILNAGA